MVFMICLDLHLQDHDLDFQGHVTIFSNDYSRMIEATFTKVAPDVPHGSGKNPLHYE